MTKFPMTESQSVNLSILKLLYN